jgi:hypothetical protein
MYAKYLEKHVQPLVGQQKAGAVDEEILDFALRRAPPLPHPLHPLTRAGRPPNAAGPQVRRALPATHPAMASPRPRSGTSTSSCAARTRRACGGAGWPATRSCLSPHPRPDPEPRPRPRCEIAESGEVGGRPHGRAQVCCAGGCVARCGRVESNVVRNGASVTGPPTRRSVRGARPASAPAACPRSNCAVLRVVPGCAAILLANVQRTCRPADER